ncbi:uncharacterized protein [Macrobrachium rosenbergii]
MRKVSLLTAVMLITSCSWSSFSNASREKRYLYTNVHAPVTLGFILNLPISFAIPSFAHKLSRSLSVQNIIYEDEETPELMYWDAAYLPQLQKLTSYFAYLELFSMGCQERLICELAAEPETFSPMAEAFLKELRPLYGPVKRSSDGLMWRYMLAMKDGFTAPIEACGRSYPKCPLTAKRIFNMPLLKVWQFLASKFSIQLV